ncbi:signal peptidase II [Candidatus Hoaglandella endobia]|uniref:Lipoprotein signal peptidase n=1 Tax=Candidatus Hoaglandella endobia TaxID=1778263 RepID=A0A143WUA4_9ENTR|nr:signal peptidase II [Candidatus Hoaglandella endobia]CUX97327.1 Lipoprotein signal peptidase [Candidatus Hoaglandella endobia]
MNNSMFTSTRFCWLWITSVVLLLDLSSKKLIMTYCALGKSVVVIPFINFTYVHNPGAAFSFLADQGGWQCWLFSVIALVITVMLLVMMYQSDYRNRLLNAAYAMIIGGALGNLFDRMVHGVVIDFIDFYVSDWHWPTFNVADLVICIGALFMLLDGFFCPANKITMNTMSNEDKSF